MCVVSMIMDHYTEKWTIPSWPTFVPNMPTEQEIDEFRRLLERAREYDKRNNEPDCELESKKAKVRELAESLGVKIDFL